VSVIPLPKPEPEPPPADERARTGTDDADGWALLEALRRRLDDQAAQGRKTQVQVGQLADSIGALVAEQRRRSKWLNLNSFVAYVIFTVVVGAGFYALYRSRASELVDARNTARHERDLAAQRADEATAKVAARERADAVAWEAFQLLEAGKRADAAAKLASLGTQPLSRTERAVLAARAHETQVMEVDAALKAAAASFKAGRYGDVIAPLEAALVGEPSGARSGAIHYFLGVAYAKANDLAKATAHLQVAVAADTEHDDVRFQLASALDRSGHYAKARAEYDQFATAYPQLGLAVYAMRRSATLARMPAVAPNAIAPASGSAPTNNVAPTANGPTNGAPNGAANGGAATNATPGAGAANGGAATNAATPGAGAANPGAANGASTSGASSGGAPNTGAANGAPKTGAATVGSPPAKPALNGPAPTSAPATAPKPATPAPAPKNAPKPAPTPKPVEPAPTNEGSAGVTPMSTTRFDREEESISIDRGQQGTQPMTAAPTSAPTSNTDAMTSAPMTSAPMTSAHTLSTSSVERGRPAREAPSPKLEDAPRDRAPTELPPTPKAGTPAPSMPAPPPVERAPAPTHEPPVDREPAPAPRTPPRAETTPPHERF